MLVLIYMGSYEMKIQKQNVWKGAGAKASINFFKLINTLF